jgi:hypothetical protein
MSQEVDTPRALPTEAKAVADDLARLQTRHQRRCPACREAQSPPTCRRGAQSSASCRIYEALQNAISAATAVSNEYTRTILSALTIVAPDSKSEVYRGRWGEVRDRALEVVQVELSEAMLQGMDGLVSARRHIESEVIQARWVVAHLAEDAKRYPLTEDLVRELDREQGRLDYLEAARQSLAALVQVEACGAA